MTGLDESEAPTTAMLSVKWEVSGSLQAEVPVGTTPCVSDASTLKSQNHLFGSETVVCLSVSCSASNCGHFIQIGGRS